METRVKQCIALRNKKRADNRELYYWHAYYARYTRFMRVSKVRSTTWATGLLFLIAASSLYTMVFFELI